MGAWERGSGASFQGHERPRASVSFRWIEWRNEHRGIIRNSFMVNGLRRSSNQSDGLRWDSVTYTGYAAESRLGRRAQEQSRYSRDFHHGLLSANFDN